MCRGWSNWPQSLFDFEICGFALSDDLEKFVYLGIAPKNVFPNYWWLIWLIWLQTILFYLINVKFGQACLDPTTPQYSLKCSFSHNERYLFKDLLSPLSKYTSVNIYNSEKHAFTFHLVIMKDTFSKTCFYLFQTVLMYIWETYL